MAALSGNKLINTNGNIKRISAMFGLTVDPNWTEETEDGLVPQDWEQWLSALLRPGRWICQYSLRAAAARLGTKVIMIGVEETNHGKELLL